MPALAIVHREQIIQRIAAGETRSKIAADLGISGPAISQQLANDPEYRAAREQGTEQRLDEAEEMIASSSDGLTLARARDWWRAVSWRAEREYAHRWGQRPSTAVQVNGEGTTVKIVSWNDTDTE